MGRLRFLGQEEVDIQLRNEPRSSQRRLVPWDREPRQLQPPSSRPEPVGSLNPIARTIVREKTNIQVFFRFSPFRLPQDSAKNRSPKAAGRTCDRRPEGGV